jgi:hypothetical protein
VSASACALQLLQLARQQARLGLERARRCGGGAVRGLLRSNSAMSSSASRWPMVMLTAEGTRFELLALRQRRSLASSTARKMCTLSLVKAMADFLPVLSEKLK